MLKSMKTFKKPQVHGRIKQFHNSGIIFTKKRKYKTKPSHPQSTVLQHIHACSNSSANDVGTSYNSSFNMGVTVVVASCCISSRNKVTSEPNPQSQEQPEVI